MKPSFSILSTVIFSLSAIALVGCSSFERNPPPSPSSVVLFDSQQQLQGINHEVLGPISGAACQISINDPLVTVRQAESQIQRQAQRSGANAVLIENCEIIQNVPGCVRQTVCKGQAIKFTPIN
ncbi:Rcs stress response system protein RcsF [Thorsellia kenyensis]|uniref:Rcs stress response system protein RcsF n=1 Tax=Thorsellia kenyensis TaxID=1549888 RepID=A0ABV6C7E3_9GAMM